MAAKVSGLNISEVLKQMVRNTTYRFRFFPLIYPLNKVKFKISKSTCSKSRQVENLVFRKVLHNNENSI